MGVQTLPLADIVTALTRQNILSDMLRGGDARSKWSAAEGDNALKIIRAKRKMAAIAEGSTSGFDSLGASDDADSSGALQQLMRQDSLTQFLATRKIGKMQQDESQTALMQRRRAFRKVRARLPPPLSTSPQAVTSEQPGCYHHCPRHPKR